MPLNDTGKNACLTGGLGNGITHYSLHDTFPGTGTNAIAGELTGGSPAYARLATTWSAAASGLRSGSTGALAFDVPAGSRVAWLGYFNAATGNTNNYLGCAPWNGSIKGFGTVDAADVTANTITSAGHGLANTNRVVVYNVFAETIPAGLTEGTEYFVVGAATDTFQVSLTSGGAAVDITAVGELFFQSLIPETFGSQGQATLAINAVTLDVTGV